MIGLWDLDLGIFLNFGFWDLGFFEFGIYLRLLNI